MGWGWWWWWRCGGFGCGCVGWRSRLGIGRGRMCMGLCWLLFVFGGRWEVVVVGGIGVGVVVEEGGLVWKGLFDGCG